MNIIIIGFGAAGRFYHELLKKSKKVKKIYIYDANKKIIDRKYYLEFNEKNIKNKKFIQQ